MGSNDLIAEEAYYWNYANHLDFSYLDHPPMVAILIKLFTSLFGINEFTVRFSSIICWCICAFFSYQLTELIKPKAGKNAVLLVSILPFFFIQYLVMTPDLPLLSCWSAVLYYCYLALVNNEARAWYYAGFWLGLGMLSKYTILLLAPAVFIYIINMQHARHWLTDKALYLAAVLAFILFLPVIYWNATHEWASFLFQSTRRMHTKDGFSLHELVGLLFLFLTPLGMLGFIQLFQRKELNKYRLSLQTQRFIQIFTLVPLIIFSVISITNQIKFNWIGPLLLAIIPWLALQIEVKSKDKVYKYWILTGMVLLTSYTCMLGCIRLGWPDIAYRSFLTKFIDWDDFQKQVSRIAFDAEKNTKSSIVLLPIDRYGIASELAFYQAKDMRSSYPIVGSDLFGYESLMYRYWSYGMDFSDKTIMLITNSSQTLNQVIMQNKVIALSEARTFWAHNQGHGANISPYYYQMVKLKIN